MMALIPLFQLILTALLLLAGHLLTARAAEFQSLLLSALLFFALGRYWQQRSWRNLLPPSDLLLLSYLSLATLLYIDVVGYAEPLQVRLARLLLPLLALAAGVAAAHLGQAQRMLLALLASILPPLSLGGFAAPDRVMAALRLLFVLALLWQLHRDGFELSAALHRSATALAAIALTIFYALALPLFHHGYRFDAWLQLLHLTSATLTICAALPLFADPAARRRLFQLTALLLALFLALVSLHYALSAIRPDSSLGWVWGKSGHPGGIISTHMALYVAVAALALVALLWQGLVVSGGGGWRLYLATALLLSLAAVLLAILEARGSMFAFAAAVVALPLLPQLRRLTPRYWTALFILSILLIVALFLMLTSLEVTSLGIRFQQWLLALAAWRESPLFGHGLFLDYQLFTYPHPFLDPVATRSIFYGLDPWADAHNHYLSLLLSGGVVGTLLWLLLPLSLLPLLFRGSRPATLLALPLLSLLVVGLSESWWQNPPARLLFFAALLTAALAAPAPAWSLPLPLPLWLSHSLLRWLQQMVERLRRPLTVGLIVLLTLYSLGSIFAFDAIRDLTRYQGRPWPILRLDPAEPSTTPLREQGELDRRLRRITLARYLSPFDPATLLAAAELEALRGDEEGRRRAIALYQKIDLYATATPFHYWRMAELASGLEIENDWFATAERNDPHLTYLNLYIRLDAYLRALAVGEDDRSEIESFIRRHFCSHKDYSDFRSIQQLRPLY